MAKKEKSEYGIGQHPNSQANLKKFEPGHIVPPEVRKKAAAARGAQLHKRRLLKDAMRDILSAGVAELPDDQQIPILKEVLKVAGIENPPNADAIAMAVGVKALRGDVEAARFVRDTSGEKPVQGVEVGNLDDKPFEHIDLSTLTDDELFRMAAEAEENGE